MNCVRRIKRQGKSLLELTLALGLFSLLLASMTSTMFVLNQSERQLRNALTSSNVVARLTEQLRIDAHDATSAQLQSPPDGSSPASVIELAGQEPNKRIRYFLKAGRIDRLARDAAGERKSTFVLPETVKEAQWGLDGEPASMVRLVLQTRPPSAPQDDSLVRESIIQAAIGVNKPNPGEAE